MICFYSLLSIVQCLGDCQKSVSLLFFSSENKICIDYNIKNKFFNTSGAPTSPIQKFPIPNPAPTPIPAIKSFTISIPTSPRIFKILLLQLSTLKRANSDSDWSKKSSDSNKSKKITPFPPNSKRLRLRLRLRPKRCDSTTLLSRALYGYSFNFLSLRPDKFTSLILLLLLLVLLLVSFEYFCHIPKIVLLLVSFEELKEGFCRNMVALTVNNFDQSHFKASAQWAIGVHNQNDSGPISNIPCLVIFIFKNE